MDNKNDAPIVREAPSSDAPRRTSGRTISTSRSSTPTLSGVSAGLADFEPRQPYRLVFFGEKTSLEDVLGPLAEEFIRRPLSHWRPDQRYAFARHGERRGQRRQAARRVHLLGLRPGGLLGHADRHRAQAAGAARSLVSELEFTVVHAALGPEQVRGLSCRLRP